MKILAVDDELLHLRQLERSIRDAVPDCELTCFLNPVEALAWAESCTPEIAFLDIQMPVLNGIALAKELKRSIPRINLIFVTGFYREYVIDALPLYFSGYLQKPVTAEDVAREMENLRFPISKPEVQAVLTVQCFGNFEVFCGGKAVRFARSKTKELLAYLVDRKGARVNGNEICAVLYEDGNREGNNKASLRKCVSDLRTVLRGIGADGVFLKGFDSYALDTSGLQCDYYDWEKNEPYAVRAFHGEYMSQYSWAEKTLAGILTRESRRGGDNLENRNNGTNPEGRETKST